MEITSIGFVKTKEISFKKHSHDSEYEFHYFLTNEGNFYNQKQICPITINSLVFSPPKIEHHTDLKNTHFYFIRFWPAPAEKKIMRSLIDLFSKKRSIQLDKQTANTFAEIHFCLNSGDKNLKASGTYLFLSFLHRLLGNQTKQNIYSSNRYINHIVRSCHDSLNMSLDLDKIADELNINKSYMIRMFRKIMGCTPLAYFLRLKIDAARYLLENTRLPVKKIAKHLGFYDEFYFSRYFKKHVGCSPKNYRVL